MAKLSNGTQAGIERERETKQTAYMNQFNSFQLIWSTLQLKCHGKGNVHQNDASADFESILYMHSVQTLCSSFFIVQNTQH